MTPRLGKLKPRRPVEWALAAGVGAGILNVAGGFLSAALRTAALGSPLIVATVAIFTAAGFFTTRVARRYVVGTFTGLAGGAITGAFIALVGLLLAAVRRIPIAPQGGVAATAGSYLLVLVLIYTMLGTAGGAIGGIFARLRETR